MTTHESNHPEPGFYRCGSGFAIVDKIDTRPRLTRLTLASRLMPPEAPPGLLPLQESPGFAPPETAGWTFWQTKLPEDDTFPAAILDDRLAVFWRDVPVHVFAWAGSEGADPLVRIYATGTWLDWQKSSQILKELGWTVYQDPREPMAAGTFPLSSLRMEPYRFDWPEDALKRWTAPADWPDSPFQHR